MIAPAIEFINVQKSFGNKTILSNITFNIYPQDIFGVIGVSGAGKTTLLRTLIGYYKASGGQILFNNQDIIHNPHLIRRVFGFATQDNCFYDELTLQENLRYFGKLYQLSNDYIKKNSERLLKLVGLFPAKDQVAGNLSGGMKRRLDVACALMHDPKILILDEPTSGLDPVLRKQMWHLITKINSFGTTIVVSSHLLEEIEHICTRVAIISKGNLLVVGSPNQLKDMYSKNEEIHLESYPGRYHEIVEELKKYAAVTFYVNKGHKVVIYTPEAERALHSLLIILENKKEKMLDVDVNKPSLTEVFEAFTRNR